MFDAKPTTSPPAVAAFHAAIPRLEIVCEIHGRRIAQGVGTLEGAAAAAMRIARDLGADRLGAALLAGLEGWIGTRLRAELERARAALAINRGPIQ